MPPKCARCGGECPGYICPNCGHDRRPKNVTIYPSTFTPGEWTVHEFYHKFSEQFLYNIYWSKDGEEVAERVYSKADAYLMAASKDLYNALKDLVGNSRENWQEVNVSKETIDNALKALKKARGEE